MRGTRERSVPLRRADHRHRKTRPRPIQHDFRTAKHRSKYNPGDTARSQDVRQPARVSSRFREVKLIQPVAPLGRPRPRTIGDVAPEPLRSSAPPRTPTPTGHLPRPRVRVALAPSAPPPARSSGSRVAPPPHAPAPPRPAPAAATAPPHSLSTVSFAIFAPPSDLGPRAACTLGLPPPCPPPSPSI